ncbi:MAG: leucyl/phenylalanyl-tRNA--protein transferase [Nitrospiria bacterium]
MISRLGRESVFPNPEKAAENGLLAYGGDLNPERLLAAYAQGIFPWPHGDDWPLLWFSPSPRTVLLPHHYRFGRSMQRVMKKHAFDLRCDTAFIQVIRACALIKRKGDPGTWITPEMIHAYCRLHQMGYAHSVETWQNGALVGGLYGVSLGGAFFGESMFTHANNASKVAMITLLERLRLWGFHFVDCQMYSELAGRLGAVQWDRSTFLSALRKAVQFPTRRGSWTSEFKTR